MRHTTFRFALDPTADPVGAACPSCRGIALTYNQSLRLVTDALAAAQAGLSVTVPWSEFDLIKAFNAWKISESAGRVFVVAPDGTATKTVIGLPWRHQVSAQVLRKPPSASGGRSLHTPEAGTGG